jgi:hypothetical protein
VVPLAGVIVALLPVAAHAASPYAVSQGSISAGGMLTWYSRSVGVKGTASYTGGSGKCGKVTFSFWLDEASTIGWSGVSPRTIPTCNAKDFQFTAPGPEGGLRSVEICVTDNFQGLSTCLHETRSEDVSTAPDLPVPVPDYELGV